MQDNIRFMQMMQHQYCGSCSMPVNLPKLIHENAARNIIIVNYHSPQGQNRAVVFCGKSCMNKFKEFGPIHCVVCESFRQNSKWDLVVRFDKWGEWASLRAICSEKCRNALKPHKKTEMTCNNCNKDRDIESLQRCKRCKIAVYCDKDCQKKHWVKQHQYLCEKRI